MCAEHTESNGQTRTRADLMTFKLFYVFPIDIVTQVINKYWKVIIHFRSQLLTLRAVWIFLDEMNRIKVVKVHVKVRVQQIF